MASIIQRVILKNPAASAESVQSPSPLCRVPA
jgi:hypothetical protein